MAMTFTKCNAIRRVPWVKSLEGRSQIDLNYAARQLNSPHVHAEMQHFCCLERYAIIIYDLLSYFSN